MVWVGNTVRLSTAIRTGSVAAIHFALLAWVLTSKLVIQNNAPTPAISIELVELPPAPDPAPEPEQKVEPELDPEPATIPKPRAKPTAARAQTASPSSPADPSNGSEFPLEILRSSEEPSPESPAPLSPALSIPQAQVEPTPTPEAIFTAPLPPTNPGEESATPAQIAGALRQLECQKLTHRKHESCATTDPFTAWASNAARKTVERNTDWDRSFRSKSVIDNFYEREVRDRLHWPDEDLFADPMPPGAYNADRIRRGQEPLWSKEMRDGFRKAEE